MTLLSPRSVEVITDEKRNAYDNQLCGKHNHGSDVEQIVAIVEVNLRECYSDTNEEHHEIGIIIRDSSDNVLGYASLYYKYNDTATRVDYQLAYFAGDESKNYSGYSSYDDLSTDVLFLVLKWRYDDTPSIEQKILAEIYSKSAFRDLDVLKSGVDSDTTEQGKARYVEVRSYKKAADGVYHAMILPAFYSYAASDTGVHLEASYPRRIDETDMTLVEFDDNGVDYADEGHIFHNFVAEIEEYEASAESIVSTPPSNDLNFTLPNLSLDCDPTDSSAMKLIENEQSIDVDHSDDKPAMTWFINVLKILSAIFGFMPGINSNVLNLNSTIAALITTFFSNNFSYMMTEFLKAIQSWLENSGNMTNFMEFVFDTVFTGFMNYMDSIELDPKEMDFTEDSDGVVVITDVDVPAWLKTYMSLTSDAGMRDRVGTMNIKFDHSDMEDAMKGVYKSMKERF